MNPAAQLPRVNGSSIDDYKGRQVRLVGKIVDGAPHLVETGDGRQITVHFSQDTVQSTYVEVIGTVQSDSSVQEELLVQFGETFDLANYEELLQLSRLLPGPFSQVVTV